MPPMDSATKSELTAAELARCSDEQLCRRAVEPFIPLVCGRNLEDRLQSVQGLSSKQQALLAFWILYVYGSDGWDELCRRQAHTASSEEFWRSLKGAADFFQLVQLRAALDEVEQLRAVPADARCAASARLDEVLASAREEGLAKAAALIRNARDEFVHISA
jgi:hypothetical protein